MALVHKAIKEAGLSDEDRRPREKKQPQPSRTACSPCVPGEGARGEKSRSGSAVFDTGTGVPTPRTAVPGEKAQVIELAASILAGAPPDMPPLTSLQYFLNAAAATRKAVVTADDHNFKDSPVRLPLVGRNSENPKRQKDHHA